MSKLLKLENEKRAQFMCLGDDKEILIAYLKELQNAEASLRSIADSIFEAPFSLEFTARCNEYGELASSTVNMFKVCDEISDLTKIFTTVYLKVINR